VIPYLIGAGVLAGIAWYAGKTKAMNVSIFPASQPAFRPVGTPIASALQNASSVSGAQLDNLVPVVFNGEVWLVAPDYIGPVGINEAAALAAKAGMQLPSPGLVDAIWRQADLKLLPLPRNNVISQAVFDDQVQRIQKQIDGRPFTLLGGSFKDVVSVNGHPEIYGWHVEDGKSVAGVPTHAPVTPGPGRVIQPRSGKAHDLPGPIGFKDYAGGLRLVRKA
jgi:hypothetical protein